MTEYQIKGYEETGFLAEFEEYGVHYQLRGVMERGEFEKVLKNLKFFEKRVSFCKFDCLLNRGGRREL